jgi:DNA-binding IclR family transcriptional regulator
MLRRTGMMPAQTEHTITDPAPFTEMKQIRGQGYAMDDGESATSRPIRRVRRVG